MRFQLIFCNSVALSRGSRPWLCGRHCAGPSMLCCYWAHSRHFAGTGQVSLVAEMSSSSISHLGTVSSMMRSLKQEDIRYSGWIPFPLSETGCPFAAFTASLDGRKGGLKETWASSEGLLKSTHFLCEVSLVSFFTVSPLYQRERSWWEPLEKHKPFTSHAARLSMHGEPHTPWNVYFP